MTIHHAHKNRMTPDGKMSFAPRPAEPIADQINALIDAALERDVVQQPPRGYLGGSRLGVECHRQLAYEYFAAREARAEWLRITNDGRHPERVKFVSPFKGKTIRRFALGHMHEDLTAKWLRMAGFSLATHKPDGKQFGFYTAIDQETGEARLSGHYDGIIEAGPVALPYPVLWEHKIMKSTSWRKTLELGVASTYPVYYAQMNTYMAYAELRAALFTALNTDTSELLFEVVPIDLQNAQWATDRGVKVIEAGHPKELPRIGKSETDFKCKWCPYKADCWSETGEPQTGVARPSWLASSVGS